MNELDLFIDIDLLDEQYTFLLGVYGETFSEGLPAYDIDMWEGILNLFETILETYKPLDNPRVIVVE